MSAIHTIIDLMEQLNEAHLHLIELGEEKKQAVIKNDVSKVIALVNRESKQVKIIEELEQSRTNQTFLFLQEHGIKSKLNLTVSELSRLVFDPEVKLQLKETQAKLHTTLLKLKRLNELNKQLIKQALDYIDYSIDLLSYRDDNSHIYQHPAEKNAGASKPGFFDARG
nr:flagellar protein FlgN [Paenibacillus pinistramenti]